MSPRGASRPAVRLCGLGALPPGEITLETAQALSECAVVFTDEDDPETLRWLRRRCRGLRPPAPPAEIVRAARRASPVGLAVRGHPSCAGPWAAAVARLCRRAGLALETFAAVTPVSSAFAWSQSYLGGDYGHQGLQALRLEDFARGRARVDRGLPLVIYGPAGRRRDWSLARRRLAGLYPPGHPVWSPDRRSPPGAPAPLARAAPAPPAAGVWLVEPSGGGGRR